MAEAKKLTLPQRIVLGIARHVGHVNRGRRGHNARVINSLDRIGLLQEQRYSTYSWWTITPAGRRALDKMEGDRHE